MYKKNSLVTFVGSVCFASLMFILLAKDPNDKVFYRTFTLFTGVLTVIIHYTDRY